MTSNKVWVGRIKFNRDRVLVLRRITGEQKETAWKITLQDLWRSQNDPDYFMAVLMLLGMIDTARTWSQKHAHIEGGAREFTFIINRHSGRCGGYLIHRRKLNGTDVSVPIAVATCSEWAKAAFSVLNMPLDTIRTCLYMNKPNLARQCFKTLAKNNIHLLEDDNLLGDLEVVYNELFDFFAQIKGQPAESRVEHSASASEAVQDYAKDDQKHLCDDASIQEPTGSDGEAPEIGCPNNDSVGECRKHLAFA